MFRVPILSLCVLLFVHVSHVFAHDLSLEWQAIDIESQAGVNNVGHVLGTCVDDFDNDGYDDILW